MAKKVNKKIEIPEFLKTKTDNQIIDSMTLEKKMNLLNFATLIALNLPTENGENIFNIPKFQEYGNDFFGTLDLLSDDKSIAKSGESYIVEFKKNAQFVYNTIIKILENGISKQSNDPRENQIIDWVSDFIKNNFATKSVQSDKEMDNIIDFFNNEQEQERIDVILNTFLYTQYKSKAFNTRFISELRKQYALLDKKRGDGIIASPTIMYDINDRQGKKIDINKLTRLAAVAIDRASIDLKKHMHFSENEKVNSLIETTISTLDEEQKMIYFRYVESFYEREWENAYLDQSMISISSLPPYIYRAGTISSTSGNIEAHNVYNDIDAAYHIENGSKSGNYQTPFISTTSDPKVMATYMYNNDSNNPGYNMGVTPIVIDITLLKKSIEDRIDKMRSTILPGEKELLEIMKSNLEQQLLNSDDSSKMSIEEAIECLTSRINQLGNSIYQRDTTLPQDCFDARFPQEIMAIADLRIHTARSDQFDFNIYSRSKRKSSRDTKSFKTKAAGFGPASAEMLFKGSIPAAAVIPMDRLTFDLYQTCENELMQKLLISMKQSVDYKLIMSQIISKISDFSDLEMVFINDFYFGNNDLDEIISANGLSISDSSKKDIVLQSLRNAVCKKIFGVFASKIKTELGIDGLDTFKELAYSGDPRERLSNRNGLENRIRAKLNDARKKVSLQGCDYSSIFEMYVNLLPEENDINMDEFINFVNSILVIDKYEVFVVPNHSQREYTGKNSRAISLYHTDSTNVKITPKNPDGVATKIVEKSTGGGYSAPFGEQYAGGIIKKGSVDIFLAATAAASLKKTRQVLEQNIAQEIANAKTQPSNQIQSSKPTEQELDESEQDVDEK